MEGIVYEAVETNKYSYITINWVNPPNLKNGQKVSLTIKERGIQNA